MRTVHEHNGAKVIQLRDQLSVHLIGDNIALTVYEFQEPGHWYLGCSAVRIEDQEFEAKPHDVDDALRVAIRIVSDRLELLMRQWQRELNVMTKVIEKDVGVDQPPAPELGSGG